MGQDVIKKEIDELFENFPKVRLKSTKLALEISEKALKLSRKINDAESEAKSLVRLAACYIYLSKYSNALDSLNQALKISQIHNFRTIEGEIYNCFGVINEHHSNYSDCLDYYFRALKIFKEVDDKQYICMVMTNITGIYFVSGDHDNAVKYSELTYKSVKEYIPNSHTIYTRSLMNLGEAWLNSGDSEKALGYFNEALAISEKNEDFFHFSECLYSIAEIHRRLNNIPEAFERYAESKKIKEQLNHPLGIVRNCIGLAMCYIEYGDLETALSVLFRSLKDTKSFGYKLEEIQIYKLISEITSKVGTKDRFIKYFTIYKERETDYFKEQFRNKAILTGMLHEMNMNNSFPLQTESQENKILSSVEILRESVKGPLEKIHSSSVKLLSANLSQYYFNEKVNIIKNQSEQLKIIFGIS